MIVITTEQFAAHKKWIEGHLSGQQLVLSGANLSDADLSGADLRRANLSGTDLSGANLSGADLRGSVLNSADLRRADLRGADLRGSVLSGANLSSANLSSADLRRANLSDAGLSSADLSSADLRGAVLSYAILNDADLSGTVGLSIVADAPERLQEVARAALKPNALDMSAWHTCETTHCMAGWAVHLAGEPGRILESMMGTEIAGLCLLGPEAHRYFFKGNIEAHEFLQGVLKTAE